MKKLLLLSVLLIMCLLSQAQIAGINFKEAKVIYSDNEIVYEKLVKTDGNYVIFYDHTPVGIKHCMDKMSDIMVRNDFTAENAWKKEILLADYVDGLLDYSSLCTSLRVGSSEVIVSWIKEEYMVILMMTSDVVTIGVSKL